jgi:UDP-N-acetylglucosamine diphosphorylase/glucosamine-1-phosphate N-acetyltransferase
MSVRTAVVLAAGEGTRLRPLTRNRPKPMLPAANHPILEHVLDALVDAGIERLVIVVGYRSDRVQEYFGPRYRETPIEYVKQEKQLGSGHALLQVSSVVDEPMLVVNGDRLIESRSVSRVISAFEDDVASAAMAVIERPDPGRYGVVSLRGQNVERIIEKPESEKYRLINAGIYAFDGEIFDVVDDTPRQDGELALPDTIGELIEETSVRGVQIDGMWVDATYPWDLLEVALEVLQRGRTSEPEREEGVWVDNDAIIHENATLRAPVVVGPDCEIGPGSVVGPNVAVGRNGTIGSNVTVERAVLDSDSRVGHGSTLVDTVFGQDVHLGVNSNVPGGQSDVRVGREVFEDQQLGAVLADRVRGGGNVCFEPGTLVGPDVTIATGAYVRGRVREGAEVVR